MFLMCSRHVLSLYVTDMCSWCVLWTHDPSVFPVFVPVHVLVHVTYLYFPNVCSRHVFPMLSLLKSDCSPQDLEQALQKAIDLVDFKEQQHHHNAHYQPQQPQLQPADDKETADVFLKEMLESGFTKTLVLKAMKEVDVKDIEEGKVQHVMYLGSLIFVLYMVTCFSHCITFFFNRNGQKRR